MLRVLAQRATPPSLLSSRVPSGCRALGSCLLARTGEGARAATERRSAQRPSRARRAATVRSAHDCPRTSSESRSYREPGYPSLRRPSSPGSSLTFALPARIQSSTSESSSFHKRPIRRAGMSLNPPEDGVLGHTEAAGDIIHGHPAFRHDSPSLACARATIRVNPGLYKPGLVGSGLDQARDADLVVSRDPSGPRTAPIARAASRARRRPRRTRGGPRGPRAYRAGPGCAARQLSNRLLDNSGSGQASAKARMNMRFTREKPRISGRRPADRREPRGMAKWLDAQVTAGKLGADRRRFRWPWQASTPQLTGPRDRRAPVPAAQAQGGTSGSSM